MNILNRKSDDWDRFSTVVRSPVRRQDPVAAYLNPQSEQGSGVGASAEAALPSAEELTRIAVENAERERVLAQQREDQERREAEEIATAERKAAAEKEVRRRKEDQERADLAYEREKEIEDQSALRKYESEKNALDNAKQTEVRENMKTLQARAEEDKADKAKYELAEMQRNHASIEATTIHKTKLAEEFYDKAKARVKTVLIIGGAAFALFALFKIASTDWTKYIKVPEKDKEPVVVIEKTPQPKIQFQPQQQPDRQPGDAKHGPVPDGDGAPDSGNAKDWGWDKYYDKNGRKLSPG